MDYFAARALLECYAYRSICKCCGSFNPSVMRANKVPAETTAGMLDYASVVVGTWNGDTLPVVLERYALNTAPHPA